MMKAFLILEDGHVFTGTSIGSQKEVISEIVFNTSMTGYLEVLTDPSYAGQAVCMTYPLIGNYGICYDDFRWGFFYEKNYDLSQEKNMDGFSCMCTYASGTCGKACLPDGGSVGLLLPESRRTS